MDSEPTQGFRAPGGSGSIVGGCRYRRWPQQVIQQCYGIPQGDRGDAVPVQESLPLVQLASFFAELFGQGQWALDAEAVEQPAVLTLLLGELQQPGQYGCRRFPVIASQPQGRAA